MLQMWGDGRVKLEKSDKKYGANDKPELYPVLENICIIQINVEYSFGSRKKLYCGFWRFI